MPVAAIPEAVACAKAPIVHSSHSVITAGAADQSGEQVDPPRLIFPDGALLQQLLHPEIILLVDDRLAVCRISVEPADVQLVGEHPPQRAVEDLVPVSMEIVQRLPGAAGLQVCAERPAGDICLLIRGQTLIHYGVADRRLRPDMLPLGDLPVEHHPDALAGTVCLGLRNS